MEQGSLGVLPIDIPEVSNFSRSKWGQPARGLSGSGEEVSSILENAVCTPDSVTEEAHWLESPAAK